MAYDYSRFVATAERLILKFGADLVLTKRAQPDPSAYTPGVPQGVIETPYPGFGVKFDVIDQRMTDEYVRLGDCYVLVKPKTTDGRDLPQPTIGDRMTVDGEEWNVVKVDTIRPATTTIFHTVYVRGVLARGA